MIRRFFSISSAPSIPDVQAKVKDLLAKGLHDNVINLYLKQFHPFFPNHGTAVFILPSAIKACTNSQTHKLLAHQLHCCALKNGFDSESTVSNSLISMYAKFSDPLNAYYVFDTMPHRDTISWNAMINCYVQNGVLLGSTRTFKDMYSCGFVPKPELIGSVLSVCAQMENFGFGKSVHSLVIVDERIDESVFLSTALVDFYWRARDKRMAFRVFDRMVDRNVVSWTAMITGCVADHDYAKALEFFRGMQVENIRPNRVTLISILPVCADLGLVNSGKEILGYSIRGGFDRDLKFSSAAIDMFCGWREFQTAKHFFDRATKKDVVMWSCMIAGYSRNTDTAKEAMKFFCEMQKQGIRPNSITLLSVISACTNLSSVDYSRAVHGYVLKSCLITELNIQNSLISMYAKCGFLQDSIKIFKEMLLRDPVSWTAIIGAYGLYGYGEDALQLFRDMQAEGMKVDAVTLLEVITACNHAGLAEEGHKLFIDAMEGDKIALAVEHYACYVDLLGRAGKIEDACDLIDRMPMKPSPRIWSSLVSACKVYGRLEVAGFLAHKLMESEPENAANCTLLSLISAKSGDWDGVEEIRRGMKLRNFRKNYGFSRI